MRLIFKQKKKKNIGKHCKLLNSNYICYYNWKKKIILIMQIKILVIYVIEKLHLII